MPIAIILGLPKHQTDRIKGALKKQSLAWREGWSVIFIPPSGAREQLREADIRAVLHNVYQAKESVHIFGIMNQGGGRKQEIAGHFIPYFRFRWLPGKWLALPYPAPMDFISSVNSVLGDEDDWRHTVQPKDIGAALLLPKVAFSSKLSDLWDLAAKYGDGCNAGCARRIEDFARTHHKPHSSKGHPRDYFWTDDDQRVFDHTQEQHGEAPEWRQWKYSFRMPKGFHYDVRHACGRKFSVTGALRGEVVKAGGYVNLDPHGYFRDGNC